MVMLAFTLFFSCCSTDIENNNIIVPGWNETEVVKTGSNFILNVGESDYGKTDNQKSKSMTRAIDSKVSSKDAIQVSLANKLNGIIGLNYSNNMWDQYNFDSGSQTNVKEINVVVGSNRGYVYATSDLDCPYETTWKSSYKIDEASLTIDASIEDGYAKPVPVQFWGNHALAINDATKTTYYEGQETDGWSIGSVKTSTKTVAISKNIQYANSAISATFNLGEDKILAWYDAYEQVENGVKGIKVTSDHKSDVDDNGIALYPDKTDKKNGLDRIVSGAWSEQNCYYHERHGKAIKIFQSNNAQTWHFIGDEPEDDINFIIEELRIESSKSVTYNEDFNYTCSDEQVPYKYTFYDGMIEDSETAYMTVLPTNEASSKVIIKCKINKFPTSSTKKFDWYIEKTVNSDEYVAVKDNTEFFIIGKISQVEGKTPTGTPYKDTWTSGIYVPDAITKVNLNINNLCVKGAVVTDPDGQVNSNTIFNFDYEYGEMEGSWSTGYF